ncbi:hypothetical protein [Streptomyces sp. NPDC013489]|uniref:hypothetical protein n=1 Tax=Streptomyces sp. NPDC013489 TaxID=3155606 RepID=UPI00340D90ED
MTFILMTCGPMLAAVLMVHWEPRAPRHGRRAGSPVPTPRRTLMYCRGALSISCCSTP